ncbi:VWA domain-containing protein [Puniceicoccaceae bacterium K14]|nr:VWA domain-containing protein [Puniceicoccaceae bacterium K14]
MNTALNSYRNSMRTVINFLFFWSLVGSLNFAQGNHNQTSPSITSRGDSGTLVRVEDLPKLLDLVDSNFMEEMEPELTYRVTRKNADENQEIHSKLPAGYLYNPATEESERIEIPLQNTYVVMDITPGLAETTIVQEFTNTTDSTLEATYLFPLPTNATVTDMELHFEDRIITSDVQEKQQARTTYESAKAAGKKAAIIEKHFLHLFTTSVANFQPGETVEVHISYIEKLPYDRKNGYSIRFPMIAGNHYFPKTIDPKLTTPRRFSGKKIHPNTQNKNSPSNHENPHPGFSAEHLMSFDIMVSGIPIESVSSTSHDLEVKGLGTTLSISLADQLSIPDRDFQLSIEVDHALVTQASVVNSSTDEANYGLLTLFPPKEHQLENTDRLPRDIIFLFDHSGSMSGDRIANTKAGIAASLDQLAQEDRFNIVAFNSDFSVYSKSLVPANKNNIQNAKTFIENVEASGGNVMQPALIDSLKRLPNETGRNEIIVFFSDGYLGEESTLLSILENDLGSVRLFTYGIGSDTNNFMIQKMAEAGRGQSRFITNDQNIAKEITDLFEALNSPVLSDIELTFFDAHNKPIELLSFPHPIPDLYLDAPVQTIYMTEGPSPTYVVMKAHQGNTPIYEAFHIQSEDASHAGIEFLFAQKWIDQLQTDIYRAKSEKERQALLAELTEIAVLFQLVTEYTSRVAVEKSSANSTKVNIPGPTRYIPGDDIFELSPFEVGASDDLGWRSTNSSAGTSLNTSIKDIPISIEVITSEFLEDIGANDFDDALSYSAGMNIISQKESFTNNNFNTDQNGSANPVNVQTISRIEVQNSPTVDLYNSMSPFETANIIKVRAFSERLTELGAILGSEDNYSGYWVDHNQPVLDTNRLSIRSIVSKIEDTRSHESIYFQSESSISDQTQISASIHKTDISEFGSFENYNANISQSIGDNVYANYKFSHNSIGMNSTPRFLINQTASDQFDFANAAQTYSTTNFDQQTKKQHTVSTNLYIDGNRMTHDVAVFVRHTENSESLMINQDPDSNIHEKTNTFDFAYNYQMGLLEDAIRLLVGQKLSQKEGNITHQRSNNLSSNIGLKWDVLNEVTLKINYVESSEDQTILQQSYINANESEEFYEPADLESSNGKGHDIGIAFDLFDSRVSGNLLYFNTSQSNLAHRDWVREKHLNNWYLNNELDLIAPAIFGQHDEAKQEGASFNLNLQPIRAVAIITNIHTNWTSDLPTQGGETKISSFGRYKFTEGFLRGLKVNGGLRYRDSLRYNDGYILPEYLVIDLGIGYEFNIVSSYKTAIDLNLKNITNDEFQNSRFNRRSGREIFLSFKTEF